MIIIMATFLEKIIDSSNSKQMKDGKTVEIAVATFFVPSNR